jgi:hypothetical protein
MYPKKMGVFFFLFPNFLICQVFPKNTKLVKLGLEFFLKSQLFGSKKRENLSGKNQKKKTTRLEESEKNQKKSPKFATTITRKFWDICEAKANASTSRIIVPVPPSRAFSLLLRLPSSSSSLSDF